MMHTLLNCANSPSRDRKGAAIILVLVFLAVLAVMMTAVVSNNLAHKRYLQRREHQVQAYWLAQAGIEHAAGRLLSNDKNYTGETLDLIADGQVRIVVEPQQGSAKSPGTFLVTSEAVFPKGETGPASTTAERTFRLKRENGKSVLEVVRD